MWVKETKMIENEIFQEVIKDIPTWRGTPRGNSSPYEFFSDYLKENFDLTLFQCNNVCEMLKEHYQIDKFYYQN